MKIKDYIYQTPEMTEEKLLEIIKENLPIYRGNSRKKLQKALDLPKALLDEFDLIQDKKSNLTRSERNEVVGFVGICMIQMTKGYGTSGERDTTASSKN